MPDLVLNRTPAAAVPVTHRLRAGAARVDITPILGGPSGGYGIWGETTSGVWQRLFATALVIDDGEGARVALVGVDLHSGARYLCERIAERTSPSVGITIDRLILGATHTHCGPAGFYADRFYDRQAGSSKGFFDTVARRLAGRIALAIEQAVAGLRDARVGHADLPIWGWNQNRSFGAFRANGGGTIVARDFATQVGGIEPPAGLEDRQLAVDPGIRVTWAESTSGLPIGVFSTFASHGTSMLPMRARISSDWMGWVARAGSDTIRARDAFWTVNGKVVPIEQRHRVWVAAASGAQGDTNPTMPGGSVDLYAERRDGVLTPALGERYAAALVEACIAARAAAVPQLRVTTRYVEADSHGALEPSSEVGSPTLAGSEALRSVYDHPDEHISGLMRKLSRYIRDRFPEPQVASVADQGRPHWPKCRFPDDLDLGPVPLEIQPLMREVLERLQGQASPVFPLRIASVGSRHWFCVPGEPTTWLSHRLERALVASLGGTAAVVGLSGDYLGYLTSRDEYDAQHYEGSSTLFGAGTGAWLEARLVALAGAASAGPVDAGSVRFRALEPSEIPTPRGRPIALSAHLAWTGGVVSGGFDLRADSTLRLDEGAVVRLELEEAGTWVEARWHGAPVDDQERPFDLVRTIADRVAHWTWSWRVPVELVAGWVGRRLRAVIVPKELRSRQTLPWPEVVVPAAGPPPILANPVHPAGGATMDTRYFVDAVNGRYERTTNAELLAMFAANKDTEHLVVHLHGGLVSRGSIVDTATRLLVPAYEAAGAHPIVVVWNSDLGTVLARNAAQIAADVLFKRLLPKLVRFLGRKLATGDGSRSVAGEVVDVTDAQISDRDFPSFFDEKVLSTPGGPKTRLEAKDETDLEQRLREDPHLIAHFDAVVRLYQGESDLGVRSATLVEPEPARRTLELISNAQLERALQASGPAPGGSARGLAIGTLVSLVWPIVRNVVRRVAAGRHHGIYCTIIEELLHEVYVGTIGGSVWDAMKKDAEDFFLFEAPQGPGRALVDQLAQWAKPGRTLTLVGHSTGAHMILHMLRRIADRGVAVRLQVVMLAPACTVRLLADTAKQFQQVVERWVMYSLTDRAESGYWEIPVLYPRSLLYLVSGLFEAHDDHDAPLAGMQRFWPDDGQAGYPAPELDPTETLLRDLAIKKLGAKVTWRWGPSPDAEWGSAADRHGEMDDDGAILGTLTRVVRHFAEAP